MEEKKAKLGFKQICHTQMYLLKMMMNVGRLKTVCFIILSGLEEGIPLVGIFLWKKIVDCLVAIYLLGSVGKTVYYYLFGYLILQMLPTFFHELNLILYEELKRKIAIQIDKNIMYKLPRLGLSFFDSPKMRDIIEEIQYSEGSIAAAAPWSVGTMIKIVTLVSALSIFLAYNFWLGIVYICTYIPGAYISYMYKVKMNEFSLLSIPETRKKNYYKAILTSERTAKEIRLYDSIGFFKEKFYSISQLIRKKREKLFVTSTRGRLRASLFSYSGIVGIVIAAVYFVLYGKLTVGTMFFYIGLVESTGIQLEDVIETISLQIATAFPSAFRYKKFLELPEIEDEAKAHISDTPEIIFENVFFKYPGSDEWILKDFCLKINFREKIALVGMNGAGKTTIVKLLLRLYEPTEGRLLINDTPYNEYPLEEVHRLFGVCFQNINKYAMSLRDNVTISDLSKKTTDEEVKKILERVELTFVSVSLTDGLNTQMTRLFDENGIELSGGQWQRVGLARSLFRDSKFVILDEPSSALDAEAENKIYSSFQEICSGKGGILISHRLSNIMMVDRIVMIKEGQVIEAGTHAELMRKGGRYFEIYCLQSQKYCEDKEV